MKASLISWCEDGCLGEENVLCSLQGGYDCTRVNLGQIQKWELPAWAELKSLKGDTPLAAQAVCVAAPVTNLHP